MNVRLKSAGGLVINYAMLILFGIVFVYGGNYFLNGVLNAPFVITVILIINTITMKHMRTYWIDLIFGNRTKYFTHRPGFTDEIIDTRTKSTVNTDDLIGLLQQATKKPKDNSDLKENPLRD